MKELYLLSLMVCLTLPVWGQSKARLSGMVKGFTQPVVTSSWMSGGEADTLTLSADGCFSIEYELPKPEEGYLYVKEGDERYSYCFYLSPAATLQVEVTADTVVYGGETGAQSRYIQMHRDMYSCSKTFSEEVWLQLPDFEACKQYVAKQQQLLRAALDKVTDSVFVNEKEKRLHKELSDCYMSYAIAKQKKGIDMQKDTAFMEYVGQLNINDVEQIDLTSRYIDWYMSAYPERYNLPEPAAALRYARELVSNQAVRDLLARRSLMLIEMARMFGSDVSAWAGPVYEEFLNLSAEEEMCAYIRKELQVMTHLQVGAEAVEFRMVDTEGKIHSLKDVVGKGRYTYIDFWATWCGPCCKEIPFLEKLVKKYKENMNLRFVSISLDKDREAWLKKLAVDRPEWEQYNVPEEYEPACSQAYGITGIPRFMLFDKEGRMMQASASRPSDVVTETLLEQLAR